MMKRLTNATRVAGFIAGLAALALSSIISIPGRRVRATNAPDDLRSSSPPASKLKFVVALFRHGVRSPTSDLDANNISKDKWPSLADWQVMAPDCDPGQGWGYLTIHGHELVRALGAYYGNHYEQEWGDGFNVYLWADATNQRTRETANALAGGLKSAGIKDVTVDSLPACTVDPLFHPFQRKCGKADSRKLEAFKNEIVQKEHKWVTETYKSDFGEIYKVLNCSPNEHCTPLMKVEDNDVQTCTRFSDKCKSLLSWNYQFSYASSGAEAFLLEYANAMKEREVGWGRVDPPHHTSEVPKMKDMLKLHEFYFDKTDRFIWDNGEVDPYLPSVEGSNLIREILDQMERKLGTPRVNSCPRATEQSDFVGLIGHDTNLATVGALLRLGWRFDDAPADTRGLPANDALPAGALVFELREGADNTDWVRVEYVTQSLSEMSNGPTDHAFHLAVEGRVCEHTRPCEIPFPKFKDLIERHLKIGQPFLSHCTQLKPQQQTCDIEPTPTKKISKRRRPA